MRRAHFGAWVRHACKSACGRSLKAAKRSGFLNIRWDPVDLLRQREVSVQFPLRVLHAHKQLHRKRAGLLALTDFFSNPATDYVLTRIGTDGYREGSRRRGQLDPRSSGEFGLSPVNIAICKLQLRGA